MRDGRRRQRQTTRPSSTSQSDRRHLRHLTLLYRVYSLAADEFSSVRPPAAISQTLGAAAPLSSFRDFRCFGILVVHNLRLTTSFRDSDPSRNLSWRTATASLQVGYLEGSKPWGRRRHFHPFQMFRDFGRAQSLAHHFVSGLRSLQESFLEDSHGKPPGRIPGGINPVPAASPATAACSVRRGRTRDFGGGR